MVVCSPVLHIFGQFKAESTENGEVTPDNRSSTVLGGTHKFGGDGADGSRGAGSGSSADFKECIRYICYVFRWTRHEGFPPCRYRAVLSSCNYCTYSCGLRIVRFSVSSIFYYQFCTFVISKTAPGNVDSTCESFERHASTSSALGQWIFHAS